MWQTSLSNYNGVTVMLDTAWTSADSIECFTDSAGGKQRGTSKLAKRVGRKWDSRRYNFFGTFPSRSCYKYLGTSFEKQKTDIQHSKSVVYIINRKSSNLLELWPLSKP